MEEVGEDGERKKFLGKKAQKRRRDGKEFKPKTRGDKNVRQSPEKGTGGKSGPQI